MNTINKTIISIFAFAAITAISAASSVTAFAGDIDLVTNGKHGMVHSADSPMYLDEDDMAPPESHSPKKVVAPKKVVVSTNKFDTYEPQQPQGHLPPPPPPVVLSSTYERHPIQEAAAPVAQQQHIPPVHHDEDRVSPRNSTREVTPVHQNDNHNEYADYPRHERHERAAPQPIVIRSVPAAYIQEPRYVESPWQAHYRVASNKYVVSGEYTQPIYHTPTPEYRSSNIEGSRCLIQQQRHQNDFNRWCDRHPYRCACQ